MKQVCFGVNLSRIDLVQDLAAGADEHVSALLEIGLEVVEAGWPLARRAGQLKCRHQLVYADSFAAALAIEHGAERVTRSGLPVAGGLGEDPLAVSHTRVGR